MNLKLLPNGLMGGLGTDTFAGGASTQGLSQFASDSVGGGTMPKVGTLDSGASFRLSTETIKIAGATASGVKAQDPSISQYVNHIVTLSDKTTVTISGVRGEAIVKPVGH